MAGLRGIVRSDKDDSLRRLWYHSIWITFGTGLTSVISTSRPVHLKRRLPRFAKVAGLPSVWPRRTRETPVGSATSHWAMAVWLRLKHSKAHVATHSRPSEKDGKLFVGFRSSHPTMRPCPTTLRGSMSKSPPRPSENVLHKSRILQQTNLRISGRSKIHRKPIR